MFVTTSADALHGCRELEDARKLTRPPISKDSWMPDTPGRRLLTGQLAAMRSIGPGRPPTWASSWRSEKPSERRSSDRHSHAEMQLNGRH